MAETKDYASLLPTEPPQAVMDMAEKYFVDSNALIYRVEYYPDPLTQIKKREFAAFALLVVTAFLLNGFQGARVMDMAVSTDFSTQGQGRQLTVIQIHCVPPAVHL